MEKKERGFYNLFYSICTERFSCCYFTEHFFSIHSFVHIIQYIFVLCFFPGISAFFLFFCVQFYVFFFSFCVLCFFTILCHFLYNSFSLLLFSVVLHFPSDLFFVVVKKTCFFRKRTFLNQTGFFLSDGWGRKFALHNLFIINFYL